jgi:putative oxidoreductase
MATLHSLRLTHPRPFRRRRTGIVFSLIVSFLVRFALVALFLPFSALDKLLNPGAAVDQAQSAVHSRTLAWILIGMGLFVEVVMSAAVISGFFDRLAAVILAGYCAVTALLWKQFWNTDDFRLKGPSKGRDMFWDFLKNFAVAGGFLILATSGTAYGVKQLIRHPLSSSHPYSSVLLDVGVPTSNTAHSSAGVSR